MAMADHTHVCNRCSCRWDCDVKSCRNIYRGICFWCKAIEAGHLGQPQIPHDHKWAGGDKCTICEDYNTARSERLKAKPGSGITKLLCLIVAICFAFWLFSGAGQ